MKSNRELSPLQMRWAQQMNGPNKKVCWSARIHLAMNYKNVYGFLEINLI